MKTTMKSMLAIVAGAMVFTACSNDDILENINGQKTSALKPMTFTASMEGQGGATRTAIDGLDIKWTAGDALSIFDGTGNQKFTLTDGAGTTTATFSGDAAEAQTYYALYPYAEGGSLSEGQIAMVIFPDEQKLDGSQTVDPEATLMIAQDTKTNALQFKNVCAYVKVTPKFDCTAITLTSKGTESLAGTVTVDYNNGAPAAEVTGGTGVSKVSLTGTITADKAYYIAVLPATLSSGFTLTFTTANGKYEKSTTNSLPLTRSNVTNLGEFATTDLTEVKEQAPEGSTGAATATIGGSDVDVNWVQLWEGGPKFAEYNVGVTDGKAESYGGYYAWGGNQDKVNDPYTGEGLLSGDNDTATKLWGSNWRMPTSAELEALLANCDVEWTTVNNVNGRKFTGKGAYASNSVFLPAAGYCEGGNVYSQGGFGSYWSSAPKGSYSAYRLSFDSGDQGVYGNGNRNNGYSVRAVLKETPATTGTAKATIGGSEVDVNWVQLWEGGPKFAEYNVGVTDGKAESYGGYYAWGGNQDKVNDPYTGEGLSGDNDTATKLWGSNWRMPTADELGKWDYTKSKYVDGLLGKCTVEWIDGTTKKYKDTNITGLLCTGKDAYSTNSIFLPAAGYCIGGSVSDQCSRGRYWSSTPGGSDSASYLHFGSAFKDVGHDNPRNNGYSVRAVLAE